MPKIQEILDGTDISSSLNKAQATSIRALKGVFFRNKKVEICADDTSINILENLDDAELDFSILNEVNVITGINLSTSRGCHNHCFFCTMPTRGTYRAKSLENLKKMLNNYRKRLTEIFGDSIPSSSLNISFNDDDFLGDAKRAIKFFDFLRTTDFKINFLQTAINSFFVEGKINDELIDALYPEIFYHPDSERIPAVYIGTENFDDEELKRLGKGYTSNKVEKVVEALSKRGVRQAHHLILTNTFTSLDNIFENLIEVAVLKAKYGDFFDILLPVIPNLVSFHDSMSYKILEKKNQLDSISVTKWLRSKEHPHLDYPLVEKDIPVDIDVRDIADRIDRFLKGDHYYETVFEKILIFLQKRCEALKIKKIDINRIKKLEGVIEKYSNYSEIIKKQFPEKNNQIEKLCNFLVNKASTMPSINIPSKEVDVLYKKAEAVLSTKSRSLVQRKLVAMDNLLVSLIYAREKMILEDNEEPGEYTQLIEKYIDFPNIISENCKIGLRELSDGVNRLVVLVTHSCQLRCSYCSVRKFSAEMSEDTLKKAIDLLFTSKKEEVQLQFFGGEPLLRFGIVKKGVEYAESLSEKTGKKLLPILTTNGIALDQDKINYMKNHKFTLEFSLDGSIETQLRFRKSVSGTDYFEAVMNNLLLVDKNKLDYYIISVVSPSNVKNLYKNFKFLIDKGLKKSQINYALGNYWDNNKLKILFDEIRKIVSFMNESTDNLIFINSLKTRREPVVLNSEITVDCDGTLYLETGICLEEDFNKLKNDFRIGTLDSLKDINYVFNTRSRNLKRLVDVYSKEKPEFRKIILNNIEIGLELSSLLKGMIQNER